MHTYIKILYNLPIALYWDLKCFLLINLKALYQYQGAIYYPLGLVDVFPIEQASSIEPSDQWPCVSILANSVHLCHEWISKKSAFVVSILLRQTQTKHKISVPAWFYIPHVNRMCWSNQIHLSDRVDPRIKCSPRIRIKAANKMFNNLQIGVERKFRLAPLRYIF